MAKLRQLNTSLFIIVVARLRTFVFSQWLSSFLSLFVSKLSGNWCLKRPPSFTQFLRWSLIFTIDQWTIAFKIWECIISTACQTKILIAKTVALTAKINFVSLLWNLLEILPQFSRAPRQTGCIYVCTLSLFDEMYFTCCYASQKISPWLAYQTFANKVPSDVKFKISLFDLVAYTKRFYK